MSGLLRVALLIALAGGPPSDLSRIDLSLQADRSEYSLGEPIRLTLTIRNGSAEEIAGYFHPAAWEQVTLFHRGEGQSFQPLQRPKRRGHATRAPLTVSPGQERKAEINVLARPGGAGLLIDRPGEYEFYIECRPWPSRRGPDIALKTNRVAVRVEPAPDSYRDAFSAYVKGRLPVMVQAIPHVFVKDGDVAEAVAFLDQYPTGVYGELVRTALVHALEIRKARNEATDEEKQLLGSLRAGTGQ